MFTTILCTYYLSKLLSDCFTRIDRTTYLEEEEESEETEQ